MFVHAGIIHLAFNMWCLWDLGNMAERLYGRSSFLSALFRRRDRRQPGQHRLAPDDGQRGGIGRDLRSSWGADRFLQVRHFEFAGVCRPANLSQCPHLRRVQLGVGAIARGIDNAAHIGGLVTGLIFGALVARVAAEGDRPGRRIAVAALMVLLLVLAGAGVLHFRGYMIHIYRAQQWQRQNEPERSIAELQAAVRQRPGQTNLHMMLAAMYAGHARFAEAEREYQRVMQLDAGNATAPYELGNIYVAQRRFPEAQKQFAAAAAIAPGNSYTHLAIGLMLAAQGQHQDAVVEYDKAIKLDDSLAAAYFNLGRSFVSLREREQAITAFQKAVALAPDDYESAFALAQAYEAKGLGERASEAYRRAAALKNP